jgi:hypothetical protein
MYTHRVRLWALPLYRPLPWDAFFSSAVYSAGVHSGCFLEREEDVGVVLLVPTGLMSVRCA